MNITDYRLLIQEKTIEYIEILYYGIYRNKIEYN